MNPIQFTCGILWNICERLKIRCPFAPYIFGGMIGRMPHKVKDTVPRKDYETLHKMMIAYRDSYGMADKLVTAYRAYRNRELRLSDVDRVDDELRDAGL